MARQKLNITLPQEALDALPDEGTKSTYIEQLLLHHLQRAKGAHDILRRRSWTDGELATFLKHLQHTKWIPRENIFRQMQTDLGLWTSKSDTWRKKRQNFSETDADNISILIDELQLGNPYCLSLLKHAQPPESL